LACCSRGPRAIVRDRTQLDGKSTRSHARLRWGIGSSATPFFVPFRAGNAAARLACNLCAGREIRPNVAMRSAGYRTHRWFGRKVREAEKCYEMAPAPGTLERQFVVGEPQSVRCFRNYQVCNELVMRCTGATNGCCGQSAAAGHTKSMACFSLGVAAASPWLIGRCPAGRDSAFHFAFHK
jgi:hypothetical protein